MVKKRILCVISARGGSKGVKNKNIIYFFKKPLIAWSIIQAKKSNFIKDVYVSTDSPKIAGRTRCDRSQALKRLKMATLGSFSDSTSISQVPPHEPGVARGSPGGFNRLICRFGRPRRVQSARAPVHWQGMVQWSSL